MSFKACVRAFRLYPAVLLALVAVTGGVTIPAQPSAAAERIVAVVNDEVISYSDLVARTSLALVSSGLPDTQETRQRLLPQVLRSLIDERLQLQEARRNNIAVEESEIEAALARIAQQNGMPPQALAEGLGRRGVPIWTLRSQITATIAWGKLVQRRLRPSVQIGEDEIDAALERIQANVGKPEYLAAEIFLGIDGPEQEEAVRRLAERLSEQLRGGASFVGVARQFSQAAGAANGGDLGWVQQGQLIDELDAALRRLRPGQVSEPIRSALGYHILLLRDQRVVSAADPGEIEVTLKQVAFPIGSPGEREAVAQRVAKLGSSITSCADFDRIAEQLGPGLSRSMGPVRASELPAEIRQIVVTLPVGRASPPLMGERQVQLMAVCERKNLGGSLPSRDAVANVLGTQRLDMLQRRSLRDLRQAAFIEVRL